jgi:hypothetical protein
MTPVGGGTARPTSSVVAWLTRRWHGVTGHRYGGPDLAARFALVIFGVAAMTAARSLTFIRSVPDSKLPPVPPLIWLFHQADILFLPGSNKLPTVSAVQQVQFLTMVLALACFFLAARSTVPKLLKRWSRPLAGAAIALGCLLCVLDLQGVMPYPLAIGTQHYGNDAVAVTSCATADFIRGRNPYAEFWVPGCLYSNAQAAYKTTPLQAGVFRNIRIYPSRAQLQTEFNRDYALRIKHPPEFESYYSYPAVSFLVPAVFLWLHIKDLTILYLLCYLAVAGLILWRAPTPTARRMAILAICANAALWPTIVSGATDALYSLLVLLAWTTRDRRWVSALAFGVACAARQQAWFFLLFYAILIWRTKSRREMLLRLGIVAAVFAVTNLPYVIASPGPWFEGVFGPMRDLMFPRGSGIISLSTGGPGSLPLGPRWLYSGLEIMGLGASLAFYWRTCRTHPGTGLVLAPVALMFAWRSLYSYFLPITLLALYPALVDYARPNEADPIGDARSIDTQSEEAA